MQIKIQANSKEISRRLNKRGKELSASVKRALLITAQEGINIIEERTRKGQGYKGAFASYTPEYAAFREIADRGSTPDLQFTGQMLGSMAARSDRTQAEIFFTSATESAKASGNNKKRPFFGFNRSEENELSKVFFKVLR